MPAAGDIGSMLYWLDGLPETGLPNSNDQTVDPGTMQFWLDGLPFPFLHTLPLIATLDTLNVSVLLPNLISVPAGIQSTVGFAPVTATLMDLCAVLTSYTSIPDPLVVTALLSGPAVVAGTIPTRAGFIDVQLTLPSLSTILTMTAVMDTVTVVLVPRDPTGIVPTVVPPSPYVVIPVTPVLYGVYATVRTWGGKIICRPDPDNLREDMLTIYDYGFTILGVDYKAGEADVWVVGDFTLADRWTNNFDVHRRDTPGWFYALPVGELVSLPLVRKWSPRRQFLY
jgi:hypothetical protein